MYYCKIINRMKNKIVVITGASSGIGKALAYEFGGKGACVVLAARNLEKLTEIVQDLEKLGIQAIAVKTDVTIESDCRNLIETTIQNFGRIDVMINNAGISMRALFIDLQLRVSGHYEFYDLTLCREYVVDALGVVYENGRRYLVISAEGVYYVEPRVDLSCAV